MTILDELTVQAVFVIPGYNRSSMEAMLVCVHMFDLAQADATLTSLGRATSYSKSLSSLLRSFRGQHFQPNVFTCRSWAKYPTSLTDAKWSEVTVSVTRKRSPNNYELTNYIVSKSNFPDSQGIRGGNSSKSSSCTLLFILWVIHKVSGTLTDHWLEGNCCDLFAFWGESQTWHKGTSALVMTPLIPATFRWQTPLSHLLKIHM